MARWLLKTEPGDYSFDRLESEARTVWDGVTNALALKHMRSMQPGDGVLIYHSGVQRAVVGIATVASHPYPDPKTGDGRVVVVEVDAGPRLRRPVSLAELKADPRFRGSPLLRQGRLSVVPLTEEQWTRVLRLAVQER